MAAATSGGIIAQLVAGKAVRDALFLSSFEVQWLPYVMAVAAILSLVTVLWISRLMSRYAPRGVLLFLFGLSGVLLIAEWLAIGFTPSGVAVAVYLHMAVLGPVILSAFWSLINEQFDPHTARAAVARIATGGTIGGVLGGLGAWRASTLVNVSTTLLLLAAVNLFCLIGTLAIPRRAPHSLPSASAEPPPNHNISALGALKAPYLRNLAVLVAVGAAMSALLDYVFSAQVTAAYGSGPGLLAFFSLFGLGVSVLSLLLQMTLGRVAMEKLGLAVHIAVLPGIIVLGGAAGLAMPGLVSSTVLRGAEMVQRNTLFRSAYELLYTPLEERQKRATKALIDVGFDRFGTAVGSGLAMAAVALTASNQSILMGAVVLFALATLPLARQLHRGYVGALKERMSDAERAVPADPDASEPAQVFDEKADDAVIERIERVRQHHDDAQPGTDSVVNWLELKRGVDGLLSNDIERQRRALTGWDSSSLPLVPFAILLLARQNVHVEARTALHVVAAEATGQLLDALLNPTSAFVIRRRIPAVLAVCASQRAADGLLLGLADDRFEVRYACMRALMKVVDQGSSIVFAREKVIETLKREIERTATAFSESDDGDDDEPNPLLGLIARDRVSRSVENLFSLLSLILEREGLRLCFNGLHQQNDHDRGTALEYLQTVLPSELRDDLIPLLSEAGPVPDVRAPAALLAELTTAIMDRAFESNEPLVQQLAQFCGALVGMGAALARVWTYDAKDQVLEMRASVGMYTHIDGPHGRVPLGSLKIGMIASTRTPHVTNQVIGDPRIPEQEWAQREGLVAFAGYPLVVDDQLMGVVALFAKRELSDETLSAVAKVADQIAHAIERATS
ncbi:MAG: GAF domain-containing protein [Deltaproteobacteria bacterium]|nr:GAF domain-containing protein [Deltaproteobacteria bacterium]MDQ3296913.1 GAF domain-containing protein [Myxococcota bacterium]